ncbi:hypothetical protein [Chromobacterium violaceum]|uniref:hypothetical protein n=1 Tax=Chromobacterium violaceum TaxID=536 RepID=UPI0015F9E75E|nr:hypothetical protein [Chromobacterium violaceum]MBA8735336.1 hypothetical protein [Chromobacterium violaceum]
MDEVKEELLRCAQRIIDSNSSNQIVSDVANQTFAPSISRDQLSGLYSGLASKMGEFDWSEAKVSSETVQELCYGLRRTLDNCLPHLWNGNGHNAASAILNSFYYCEKFLDTRFKISGDRIYLAGKTLESLSAVLNGLPDAVELEGRISNIVAANDFVDYLNEERPKVEELVKKLSGDALSAENLNTESWRYKEEIERQSSGMGGYLLEAEKIIDRCQVALGISTSHGLAVAFEDKSNSLNKSIRYWVGGLFAALIVGAGLGAFHVHELLSPSAVALGGSALWFRSILAALSLAGPIWFAWLATKQIGEKFKLSEDYAYKASMSKAYEGYLREADKLGDGYKDRLFSSALSRLDEQPLRFVEHKSYGSPWHEFLASDTVKEAIRVAPEFAAAIMQQAKDVVKKKGDEKKEEEKDDKEKKDVSEG